MTASLDDYKDLLDWSKAQGVLRKRINEWETSEVVATKRRRQIRKSDVDVKAMRDSGAILKDETFIASRVADSNIRQSLAEYMNYLRSSKRIMLFDPVQPTTELNVQLLEDAFSNGVKYLNWDTTYERTFDGTLTHGWNFAHVVYDLSKPLHLAVNFIPHERVIVPLSMEDFQSQEFVIVEFAFTIPKLRSFIPKYNFNPAQVEDAIKKVADDKRGDPIKVYMMYCRQDNGVGSSIIYDAWFITEGTEWLRDPAPCDYGIYTMEEQPSLLGPAMPVRVPMYIEQYPLFPCYMAESEDPKLISRKGRVFYDLHKQEAQTALWTSFVNGCVRASGLYPYVDQPTATGTVKQDDKIFITHGKLVNAKLGFYQMRYPDPTMLEALQYGNVANANEIGNMTFAVLNKQNSRTTAKEVQAAESDGALITSAQLLQVSRFLQATYTFYWMLVRNYCQNNIIVLVPDAQNPNINDAQLINADYILKPAGDVEYVKREEMKSLFMQFWSVVQNTSIAGPFLAKIIRVFFPEDGEKFAQMLEAGNPANLVAALVEILKQTLSDSEVNALSPDVRMKLQQILLQAENYVRTSLPPNGGLAQSSGNAGAIQAASGSPA